jgi:Family of unknown function (DUF5681)
MQKYGVGKGRPPAHTRFKPGISGNPSGRPKGSHGFKADLLRELAEQTEVGDAGERATVTKQRAIVMALLREAMHGDLRAIDTVIRACLAGSDDDVGEQAQAPEDRAIIAAVTGANNKKAENE